MANLFAAPPVSPCFTRWMVTPTGRQLSGVINNLALSHHPEKPVSSEGGADQVANLSPAHNAPLGTTLSNLPSFDIGSVKTSAFCPERDMSEVKTKAASIDAAIARLGRGACRIEFGTYENGDAWAYVWANGSRELTAEADAETMAEAVVAAVDKALA